MVTDKSLCRTLYKENAGEYKIIVFLSRFGDAMIAVESVNDPNLWQVVPSVLHGRAFILSQFHGGKDWYNAYVLAKL